MTKKPKILVLSTDLKTRKLTPRRIRVAVACLSCRKKKRRCDGNQPCLYCHRNHLNCEYLTSSSANPNTTDTNSMNNILNKSKKISNSIQAENNIIESNNILTVTTVSIQNNYSDTYTSNNISKFEKSQHNNPSFFDNSIHSEQAEESLEEHSRILLDNNKKISHSPPTVYPHDTIDYKRIVETLFTKENLQNIIRYCHQNDKKKDINEFLIKSIDKNINKDNFLNLNEIRMINQSILPPKHIALKLILKTWNYACVLFRFYHRPTIIKILYSLYEDNGYPKSINESRAEALIYAVLAVGALFSKDDHLETYDSNIKKEYYGDEGLKFFIKSKSLIDFADVSDLYSIQTLFMLTLFLQCSANLKSCYHYIGIALRSAIKEGLYKNSSLTGPTPIENETKKRLFWSIYKVDIYMNCILGLPSSMNEDKIDQELPLDVDDERITPNGIIESPNKTGFEKISSCGINNEHTKLLLVMSRIYDYTSQLTLSKILHKTELIKNIHDLELQLENWYKQLPSALKPTYKMKTDDERDYYLKPQKLLQLDFLLTKLTLYKPFFHFITLNSDDYPNLKFQIRMSTNCIKISIEIIRLSYDMINMDLLSGTYWYSIHTIYYSFACLTIYKYQLKERRNPNDEKLSEIENVCNLGYKILIELQNYSSAGKRILKVLELIFKQFNDKFLELNQQLINNLQYFKNNNHHHSIHHQITKNFNVNHHHNNRIGALQGSDNHATNNSNYHNYFNINFVGVSGQNDDTSFVEHVNNNNNNNNSHNSHIHLTNDNKHINNHPIGINTDAYDNNSNLLVNPDNNTDFIFNSQNFLNKLLEELELDI